MVALALRRKHPASGAAAGLNLAMTCIDFRLGDRLKNIQSLPFALSMSQIEPTSCIAASLGSYSRNATAGDEFVVCKVPDFLTSILRHFCCRSVGPYPAPSIVWSHVLAFEEQLRDEQLVHGHPQPGHELGRRGQTADVFWVGPSPVRKPSVTQDWNSASKLGRERQPRR